MYEKIKIEKFRGIDNLELNNLRQFNLFVGKNNCGKTSLLESIYIISTPANPFSSILVSNVRGHYITQPYSWTVFFNKMDIESPIRLTGEISKPKETRTLTIKTLPWKSVVQPPTYETLDLSQKGSRGEPLDEIIGLRIEFSITKKRRKKQTYESKIWLGKDKLESDPPGNYTETLKSTFPNPMTRLRDMPTWFNEVLIRKQDEKILEILKSVEPRLINLSIGAENILYCDMGFTKRLPLSTAGEGLNRLLYIILAIYRTSGGVVLIDEIENGLHYSTQEILWEAVFEAAIAFDVQVFAATHSYENVKAFNAAYEKLNDKGDKIRLFRIETKKDEIHLIDFNHEMIDMAIERDWEVR